MNRLKAPLLLMPLWPYLVRDVLWIIFDKMTACDKYAWMQACRSMGVDQRLLTYYVEDGYTNLFIAHIDMYTPACAFAAGLHGRVEILREIHARKYTISVGTLSRALRYEQIECARFLIDTVVPSKWWADNPNITRNMYQYAGEGGIHASMLILDHLGSTYDNTHALIVGAVIANKWNVLELLADLYNVNMTSMGYVAAYNGNLEFVKKIGHTAFTFMEAVRGGHMHVMEWLYMQGCSIRCINCSTHAEIHGPSVLEWLHQRDLYVSDERVHQHAALGNRVDSSEWLVSHGYAVPTKAWYWAIHYGSVEYLTWLQSQKVQKDITYVRYIRTMDVLSCFITGESSLALYKHAANTENANWLVQSMLELNVPVCVEAIRACRKLHARLVQKMMQKCKKRVIKV